MSEFIVSARKYRPVRFDEVVGQNHVSKTLKNALKTDHLGHSFLFCGPRGVGKTTSARILAKAVNCMERTTDFEPCNTCASCEAFNQNGSFNIHELDAASNNSVDDIRALVEQVRFAPQQGDYKIYIIDEVHMLSASAFNAFLKTLEEPPSYAIFILATTEKHKILPTILSRCQIFDFHRVQVGDMVKHLQEICEKEGYTAEESALHVIAEKADGALRDALSIFDRIVSYTGSTITYQSVIESLNILDYDTFFQFTDALMTQDKNKAMLLFDDCLKRGFEGDNVILGLAGHLRDLLVSRDSQTVSLLEVPADVQQRYLQQSATASLKFLLNAINIANDCDVHYKTAKNKRLHVELALLKMCFVGQKLSDQPLEAEGAPAEKKTEIVPVAIVPDEVVVKSEPKTEEAESEPTIVPIAPKEIIVSNDPQQDEGPENVISPSTQEKSSDDELAENHVEIQEKTASQEQPDTPVTKVSEEESPTAIAAEPEPTFNTPKQTQKQKMAMKAGGFNLNTLGKDIKDSAATKAENEQPEVNEEEEIIEIDPSKVENAWQGLKEVYEAKKQIALSNGIATSVAKYENKVLKVIVQGNINKDLLEQDLLFISDQVKADSGLNRLVIEFFVQEIDKTAQRTMTKQEQLALLMEKNPNIKDLTDTFDLEIDYN